MAGHLPLRKEDEPKLFKTIKEIAETLLILGELIPDFARTTTLHKGVEYKFMKLSPDFVENSERETAFKLGNFTLEQDFDIDQDLAINCEVEVHLETRGENVKVKNIFFVA